MNNNIDLSLQTSMRRYDRIRVTKTNIPSHFHIHITTSLQWIFLSICNEERIHKNLHIPTHIYVYSLPYNILCECECACVCLCLSFSLSVNTKQLITTCFEYWNSRNVIFGPWKVSPRTHTYTQRVGCFRESPCSRVYGFLIFPCKPVSLKVPLPQLTVYIFFKKRNVVDIPSKNRYANGLWGLNWTYCFDIKDLMTLEVLLWKGLN